MLEQDHVLAVTSNKSNKIHAVVEHLICLLVSAADANVDINYFIIIPACVYFPPVREYKFDARHGCCHLKSFMLVINHLL